MIGWHTCWFFRHLTPFLQVNLGSKHKERQSGFSGKELRLWSQTTLKHFTTVLTVCLPSSFCRNQDTLKKLEHWESMNIVRQCCLYSYDQTSWPKANWGGKGLFGLYLHIDSIIEESQARNSNKAGSEAEAMKSTAYWLVLQGLLSLFPPSSLSPFCQLFKKYLFYFICMFGWQVYTCTTCMTGANEGQKKALILWKCSYQWFWATVWVLGIDPGSAAKKEQQML